MKRERSGLFLLLSSYAVLCSFIPQTFSLRPVILESIQIFTTHEWVSKPTVYFQCKGENKTILPDVKERYVQYIFKGEESWQPLTDLPDKKCKRCGLYEKDLIKADDVFDEWELCPADFVDGKLLHVKDKEFNATFICPQCLSSGDSSVDASNPNEATGNGTGIILTILISTVVSAVVVTGIVAGYKYWQKRKRAQDQARFLKLFEEGDDIEDELGLGTVI